MIASVQDKQKEIAFFDAHAAADEYDVFTPEASARLVDAFVRLSGLARRTGRRSRLRVGRVHPSARTQGLRLRRARHQPEAGGARPPQISGHRAHRRRRRASAVSRCKPRRYSVERHRASPARSLALRGRGVPGAAAGREVRGFRSKPDEPVHVALPGPRLAVLQLGRRDRERAAGARPSGRGGVSSARASPCRRTTFPVSPIAMWRRAGRGSCCRSTTGSMPRCSGSASWSGCDLSCSPREKSRRLERWRDAPPMTRKTYDRTSAWPANGRRYDRAGSPRCRPG